jgi:hypothetical protein
MSEWRHGLAALGLWLAHFVLGYALILIFPGRAFVGPAIIVIGLAALGALAWLWRRSGPSPVRLAATLLAAVGILFQSVVGLV